MPIKTFIFRVDASPEMGFGHFMRMLALAQMLEKKRHNIYFVTLSSSTTLIEILVAQRFNFNLIKSSFHENTDLINLVSFAKKVNANWIVIDGYHFSSNYEKYIKQNLPNIKLMRIEDLPVRHHFADVLLSPNFDSENMKFSTESNTIQLLGLRYLILRKEFYENKINTSRELNLSQNNILITLGGGTAQSDIANLILARTLSEVSNNDYSFTLVAGKMSENFDEIRGILKCKQALLLHTNNMLQLIMQTDIAIVSGGSTMWEMMYSGIPILTIALTEEQNNYLKKIEAKNLCIHLGYYLDLDPVMVRYSIFQLLDNDHKKSELKKRYLDIFSNKDYSKKLLEILCS